MRWLKKSENNILVSADKCFYISIHYRFQNGRLSGCTLKAGRELSEPPQSFFLTAKRLTQQPLKEEKHSVNKISGIIFLLIQSSICFFVVYCCFIANKPNKQNCSVLKFPGRIKARNLTETGWNVTNYYPCLCPVAVYQEGCVSVLQETHTHTHAHTPVGLLFDTVCCTLLCNAIFKTMKYSVCIEEKNTLYKTIFHIM